MKKNIKRIDWKKVTETLSMFFVALLFLISAIYVERAFTMTEEVDYIVSLNNYTKDNLNNYTGRYLDVINSTTNKTRLISLQEYNSTIFLMRNKVCFFTVCYYDDFCKKMPAWLSKEEGCWVSWLLFRQILHLIYFVLLGMMVFFCLFWFNLHKKIKKGDRGEGIGYFMGWLLICLTPIPLFEFLRWIVLHFTNNMSFLKAFWDYKLHAFLLVVILLYALFFSMRKKYIGK